MAHFLAALMLLATASADTAGCGSTPPLVPGAPATRFNVWSPDSNPTFAATRGHAQRGYWRRAARTPKDAFRGSRLDEQR